jgi:hypothetical protein
MHNAGVFKNYLGRKFVLNLVQICCEFDVITTKLGVNPAQTMMKYTVCEFCKGKPKDHDGMIF